MRRLAVWLCLWLAVWASLTSVSAAVKVVTTIKPIHSIIAAVMAGTGEPHLMIRGADSPHTFAMRPSDARALQNADVVFWVGPELETFLKDVVGKLPRKVRSVELMHLDGMILRKFLPSDGKEEAGDSHGHGHGHDHGHDHGEDAMDPHIWLDPHNVAVIARSVASTLSEIDPAHAAAYEKNARTAVSRIERLQAHMDAKLAPVRKAPFFVFHDAYNHLAVRFGLNIAGAISLGDARKPGARRLKRLRAKLNKQGSACVFSEPQFRSSIVDTLVSGTKARAGQLDPLGADLSPGPDLYFDLMRRNTDAMSTCLGGKG